MDRTDAQALDQADPLAGYRSRFTIDEGGPIYLDGNSLGRPSVATVAALHDAVAEWGDRLVGGWPDWIDLPSAVGDHLAPLLGAGPGQVIVCDSTTVNLYKVAAGALARRPGRHVIVADADDFPTDRYVLAGLAAAGGHQLRLVPGDPATGIDLDRLASAIDTDTALVCLSQVNYRSAARLDVPGVTALAHQAGALMCWDLCHSAGAVPVGLDDSGADFAVGCSYKYLNGGPGAPGFAYVRSEIQKDFRQPIWGWFSQEEQFAMGPDYQPEPSAAALLTGTPSILGLRAVDAAVSELAAVGVGALWAKSQALTAMLVDLVASRLEPLGARLASPADPRRRGAHVSVAHPGAWPLCDALVVARRVVGDFRAPDVLRLGPAPIYTRYVDVWDACEAIAELLSSGRFDAGAAGRPRVT